METHPMWAVEDILNAYYNLGEDWDEVLRIVQILKARDAEEAQSKAEYEDSQCFVEEEEARKRAEEDEFYAETDYWYSVQFQMEIS